MKTFYWKAKNFGDTLTPIIVKHFIGVDCEYVDRKEDNKFVSVGSIIHCVKDGDVVWGTGTNRSRIFNLQNSKFLAVRGPITRSMIKGVVPQVYGDPALLLPLIYNPKIEKTHKVGYLPHYVDKPFINDLKDGEKMIDIQADWKTVIEEVLSCEMIIASSLHGIICAEAYGIPAIWVKYSDKIVGGELKYQDYFLGTDRPRQKMHTVLTPIKNLKEIQDRLLKALYSHYETRSGS